MDNIINLLEEKNQTLEKFYRLNEAELENFSLGNFDHLEIFYANREGMLDVVRKINEMIERTNTISSGDEQISIDLKRDVLKALDYKNELAERILEQDLRILSAIEVQKSNIIKELSQLRATRKAFVSYKSGSVNSNLDEEV